MYQKILLTLDGSDLSEQAIPHAINFAKASGGQIDVLCAVAPSAPSVQYKGQPPLETENEPSLKEQLIETELVRAGDYVNEHVRGLREAGLTATGASVLGHPAETILNYAAEQKADVIVMATHGRSGLGRWAFGSVADRVLRTAEVPVLLVRVAPAK